MEREYGPEVRVLVWESDEVGAPLLKRVYTDLELTLVDNHDRGRWRAVAASHAGEWFYTLPMETRNGQATASESWCRGIVTCELQTGLKSNVRNKST